MSSGAAGRAEAASLPAPPEGAVDVFGDRLPLAVRFAGMLAGDGVSHGHLGPREVPRLWERHLLNSAVVTDVVAAGSEVIDVGSGAGLPGLPMAIRAAELRMVLLEPMLRRTRFLIAATEELGLEEQCTVVRGRAGGPEHAQLTADVVVARAVAPLDRLVEVCLPLVRPGGRILALKGASAVEELSRHRSALRRLGAGSVEMHELADRVGGVVRVVSVSRSGQTRARTRKGV